MTEVEIDSSLICCCCCQNSFLSDPRKNTRTRNYFCGRKQRLLSSRYRWDQSVQRGTFLCARQRSLWSAAIVQNYFRMNAFWILFLRGVLLDELAINFSSLSKVAFCSLCLQVDFILEGYCFHSICNIFCFILNLPKNRCFLFSLAATHKTVV